MDMLIRYGNQTFGVVNPEAIAIGQTFSYQTMQMSKPAKMTITEILETRPERGQPIEEKYRRVWAKVIAE